MNFSYISGTVQLVVEVEYVPEQAELDDSMYEEFKKIFDRFSFHETAGTEVKGITFSSYVILQSSF